MILNPQTKELDIEGFVSYEERTRAWSILRLKKEVTYVMPLLKDRSCKTKYKLKIFLSLQAFQEFSNKVTSKEFPVPMVLYFERENEKESQHSNKN